MSDSTSQSQKKGHRGSQGRSNASSCEHSHSNQPCSICSPKAAKKKNNVVDIPTQKKQISNLLQKISEKLKSDPKGLKKAAVIISNWISSKP